VYPGTGELWAGGRLIGEERDVTATIPVTVAEDAAARVADLGMQREFEQMLEHARQTIPRLRQLRVMLEHDPVRPQDDPQIVIWARRDAAPSDDVADLPEWDWNP
jgi:hypothetical protein